MRETKAFPIVISGPSGVGKTTLVEAVTVRDPLLRKSISATTRPPREGEREGEDYFFVDRAEFERMKKGSLIEWAEVHGQLYGTPRSFVDEELAAGRDVVLNIDVQGGAQVRKSFPEAVLIFILPPSFEVLERRIRNRGLDLGDAISRRMDAARRELAQIDAYEYAVVNDDLDRAVDEIHTIIKAERCRRTRYPTERLTG